MEGTLRILIAEDDPAVRSVARRFLEAGGFQVLEAKSGSEALALGREQPVDLLVADLVMPDFGGLELARRLEAFRPGLPVLYLSGYTEDEAKRREPSLQVANFLQKPFSGQAFREKIRQIVKGPATGN